MLEREYFKRNWEFSRFREEPSIDSTLNYLCWVAEILNNEDMIELSIKQMQPLWARKQMHLIFYYFLCGLFSSIPGCIFLGPLRGMIYGSLFALTCKLDKFSQIEVFLSRITDLRQEGKTFIYPVFSLYAAIFTGCLLIYGLAILFLQESVNLYSILATCIAVGLVGLVVKMALSLVMLLLDGYSRTIDAIFEDRGEYMASLKDKKFSFVIFFSYISAFSLGFYVFLVFSERISVLETMGEMLMILPFTLLLGSYLNSIFASIQHLALRVVLSISGETPWNYARFLNYCVERRLLQRIGGRYCFIHRELQDHFANMAE